MGFRRHFNGCWGFMGTLQPLFSGTTVLIGKDRQVNQELRSVQDFINTKLQIKQGSMEMNEWGV